MVETQTHAAAVARRATADLQAWREQREALLAADAHYQDAIRAYELGEIGLECAIALTGVVSLIAYMSVGKPGFPDQPYKARLESWREPALTTVSLAPPSRTSLVPQTAKLMISRPIRIIETQDFTMRQIKEITGTAFAGRDRRSGAVHAV